LRPPFFRPRNLNQVLWRLLGAIVVPLLLGTLALLALQNSQDKRASQSRLVALAETLVQAVDAEFERGRAQLEVLAASPDIDAGDWHKLQQYAGDVVRHVPGSLIALVGPDGQVLFNTAVRWGEPLPNLWKLADQSREVEWEGRMLPVSSGNLSRQALDSGFAVFSDLYFGFNVRRPALSLAVPVARNGKARYALIMSYPPSVLQERIRSAVRGPDLRVSVVDRKGVVVASNGAAASKVADKATPIRIAPETTSGGFQVTSRDGVEVDGAYAISPTNGFTVRVSQPHAGHVFSTRATSLAWVLMLLTSVAVCLLLASLLSRRLARPLRQLGDDVRAGRAPPPERNTGIEELDVLAQALREGVQAEHLRMQEATRRTVAEEQEKLLRQADRQKDEFLATLAHELRNPLAPIRTAVELIRLRAPSDPVVERARGAIERQTMHLSRLVDDLLDVSRITLGRIQLREEPVDVGEVAASALDSVRDAARRAGVTLEHAIAEPRPVVRGDATRLTQCIVNVLNNAVKFTPSGGRIQLRVAQRGATAIVEVHDSGVGITPGNAERIFELFVQERHSGHGGNTGLGIGLALTRRLLQLHGGTIRASSGGPGMGSTFRIELPTMSAPVPMPKVHPHAAAEVQREPGKRVLVVDDNVDAAETLGELLRMKGYEVSLARDGMSAVDAVQQLAPRAVLLDIGLPDIDGYEAARRIRAKRELPRQPVLVAVTGWGQQADREAAEAAGFDAHLTKPVDPDALIALLDERLRPA
jgi:signal transduction histidine kinase/ActR/RegA family two-component response regulator/type II secretory pathway pseudopilin PulG